MGEFPVAPFVCAFVPGTTRKHARAVSTALPKQRESRDSSYLEHSHQSKVFESLANEASTGHHSGNLRPCAVSLTLRYSSHVGQRLRAHVFRYVQGSRP